MIRRIPAVLWVDLLLIAIAALGVYQTHYASRLPFAVVSAPSGVQLNSDHELLPLGATLHSLDGQAITSEAELEFYLDGKLPGEAVALEIQQTDGQHTLLHVNTVPTYGFWYMGVQVLVIVVFFGFGLFLWFKRHLDPAARIAHWLAFAAGSIVALTLGSYRVLPLPFDLAVRLGYLAATIATGILYVHFSRLFPHQQYRRSILWAVYGVGSILLVWAGATAVPAFAHGSLAAYREHLIALRACQLNFSLLGVLAAYFFARSYRRTIDTSERHKIKWALAGSAFSILAYIALWLLPQLAGVSAVVPEEVILFTSILAPITISIAIARHRLFDIDAVLSRTATYAISLTVVVGGYIAAAAAAAAIIGSRLPVALSAGIAVIVALVFHPVKTRLQRWVDYKFFRVRYDFREAERSLSDGLREADDQASIERVIVRTLATVLQPQGIEFVARAEAPALRADPRAVEAGVEYELLPSGSNDAVSIPVGSLPLVLALGLKRSGARYSQEDIDLLRSAAVQASLRLERVALRDQVIQEQLATERAKEINRVRSLVLSSITHDLKSPLTSVQMFAELLQGSVQSDQDREYLKIIDGESKRLTSLIDNVLDYSRIERGTMQYTLEPVSLKEIVQSALRPLSYLVDIQHVQLEVACGPGDAIVSADRSAIERAITNLVSNAIKYSGERKEVKVSLEESDSFSVLSVEDCGIGIPKDDLPTLFQPYHRVSANAKHAPGVGLGLATVQHIIQAHGGSVTVESEVGRGSKFSLTLPLFHA